MAITSPITNDTAVALRSALGPGYGFGGPSDRLFQVAVRNTTVAAVKRGR